MCIYSYTYIVIHVYIFSCLRLFTTHMFLCSYVKRMCSLCSCLLHTCSCVCVRKFINIYKHCMRAYTYAVYVHTHTPYACIHVRRVRAYTLLHARTARIINGTMIIIGTCVHTHYCTHVLHVCEENVFSVKRLHITARTYCPYTAYVYVHGANVRL